MKISTRALLDLALLCLTLNVLVHQLLSRDTKRELEVTYKHPEQYIVYDLKSTDTLVVGKVTGRYDTGSMYILTINNNNYLVTEEQYNAVNTGDVVFTHVKEVE